MPQLFDTFDLLRFAIERKGKYLAILVRIARYCPLLAALMESHFAQWYWIQALTHCKRSARDIKGDAH
jgi:hypothetical protein